MAQMIGTERRKIKASVYAEEGMGICKCVSQRKIHLAKLVKDIIIKRDETDAKSESWWLEDVFERPQISRQTQMPHLTVGKSTRRVEGSAAQSRLV